MVYQDVSFFSLFCINGNVICKAEIDNKPTFDADTIFMAIQCLTYDSLGSMKKLKRTDESRHPCRTPFDVGIDVVFPHSCPQGFVPYPVKGHKEVRDANAAGMFRRGSGD